MIIVLLEQHRLLKYRMCLPRSRSSILCIQLIQLHGIHGLIKLELDRCAQIKVVSELDRNRVGENERLLGTIIREVIDFKSFLERV